jgi:site-specific DNA-cytosine methylase
MNVLELFAGSRSIGKSAEKLGMKVFSSDINDFKGIDYVVDILEFNFDKVPFKPDVIWASPPCTGFSVAAIGHHWGGGKGAYVPKTDTAKLGIKLVEKTLEIINHFQPTYWFMENPRGVLRKMDIVKNLKRNTVTYCQYGDERMKPTDIWTNSDVWVPRKMCKNGDPCHVAAPRGSRTGTQGRSNAYERSKIPDELCFEILKSCLSKSENKDTINNVFNINS